MATHATRLVISKGVYRFQRTKKLSLKVVETGLENGFCDFQLFHIGQYRESGQNCTFGHFDPSKWHLQSQICMLTQRGQYQRLLSHVWKVKIIPPPPGEESERGQKRQFLSQNHTFGHIHPYMASFGHIHPLNGTFHANFAP